MAIAEISFGRTFVDLGITGWVLWHLTPAGRELLVALGEKPGQFD